MVEPKPARPPRPTPEQSHRLRNRAIALSLLAFAALFYLLTLSRLGPHLLGTSQPGTSQPGINQTGTDP